MPPIYGFCLATWKGPEEQTRMAPAWPNASGIDSIDKAVEVRTKSQKHWPRLTHRLESSA
jgi:hypothetical protein